MTQGSLTSISNGSNGTVGVTFQETLLDLTAIPAYRLGKLTAEAAKLSYRSTIRQVLFGLAQAYYEVLKQQRIVAVSSATLNLAQQQLDLARNRADVGEVKRSDVLSAQVTLEGDRQTLIEAENALASKRNSLANILNVPTESAPRLLEPVEYPTLLAPYATLFAEAKQKREDWKVKAIAIQQDVERRRGFAAEYAPRLVAQVNASRDDVWTPSRSRTDSWDATLAVQTPFLTGGQREIDLVQAGHQIRQTRLDYESFGLTVQQDVKDAWLQVSTLKQTLKAVRSRVAAAQQAYEDLGSQYEAGSATSVDVLIALNDLNIARRDFATQTYDYQVALRKVEEVTGTFQETRVRRLRFK